ncbi:hypothetical protein Q4580_20595 [Bacillus thuringiensis]|nr:hypothetical protein [Bacillus thuringiensis]MDO6661737.1 hypothetical protein [Bacillus thuringiensis]MDO6702483.1 hypothetical protein [Bacillus thuringiensis]
MYTHGCYTITWRGFFKVKKGTTFNTYSNEIKLSAVQIYLNREFKDRQQNEALVTHITYLQLQEGFRYLSVVQDIYNNEVVSWKIPKRNDNELVLDTLEMLAQKKRCAWNHSLFRSGIPVHISCLQQTTFRFKYHWQPLSKRQLP